MHKITYAAVLLCVLRFAYAEPLPCEAERKEFDEKTEWSKKYGSKIAIEDANEAGDKLAKCQNEFHAVTVQKLRDMPKAMRVLLSAQIYRLQTQRKDTLDEIATEKRYSRVGGVVDLKRMYALQQKLRVIDEYIAQDRAILGKQGQMSSKERAIKGVLACLDGDDTSSECDEEPISAMKEIVAEHDGEVDSF